MRKAFVVGLTGGLASGKTTVARMFRALGARVLDSDRMAHEALRPGQPTYREIRRRWGRFAICDARGRILRGRLSQLVFRRPRLRRVLEGMVHPYVRRKIAEGVRGTRRPVVIVEVPLLYEARFDKEVRWVITVACARDQQIARAARRRGWTRGEARRRLSAQMSLREKVRKADAVIMNDRSLGTTRRQVECVWNRLQALAGHQKKSVK